MFIDFLMEVFERHGTQPAMIWHGEAYTYRWLLDETRHQVSLLSGPPRDATSRPRSVVALLGDYSPRTFAIFLALIERGHVVAPLSRSFTTKRPEFFEIAEIETEIRVNDVDHVEVTQNDRADAAHPLIVGLLESNNPGIILFSSGATGPSKAMVHDATLLLEKFKTPRRPKTTIPFMLFGHIGGINTSLHVLSSGGTLVVLDDRRPETVCRAIEAHRVQVLPATPTFVHLLLLSDFATHDLSSLEVLAYGAEPMPIRTLERIAAALPHVQFIQNYGLSELGIFRSKSEARDSTWVSVGGDSIETRVRDGLLEIKARSAMLGYLNAESPWTEDGWFRTGDRVEVRGEYLRILGRESDLIIVGGEKVYPAEVESLIAEMPGVLEVTVAKEEHSITGHIVRATVRLSTDETRAEFRVRMATFLADRLPPYKIPQRVVLERSDGAPTYTETFKKLRRGR